MSSVEKYSNILDDKKEAVVTTPQSENKSLTNDDDKGTDKLDDMKEAMFTILRKDLDNFEGRYKVSTGWFNLDSELKINKFLQLNHTSIHFFMKIILKVKKWNRIKRFQ